MSFRKRRIVYSEPARADIVDILDYTVLEWGVDQRMQYRTQLRDSLNRLAEIPSLGRAREDLAPGIRVFPVGNHLVCFRVRDDDLFVLRVLHSRRDVRAIDWTSASERAEDTGS
jgi:toxin ParE1/3/4